MAMLGDGKTSYDVGSDGSGNELGACSANVRKTDIATKIRIKYFKGEMLNVALQYKGWDEWTECFTVWDVKLPSSPFLGVSALTGDISDNHDIISISTASAILKDAPLPGSQRKHSSSSSGFWGFMSLMLKLAAFALVCVAALAGWRAYSRGGRRRGGGAFGGLGSEMPQWGSKNKHF
ncbi:legume-like lectin [Ceratobasidium sp. AG-Ba]|nr:legume-like lectin [Ceratobasidium sp. AG-Ba]QRW12568.1 legume-like lectin [Ceratobasidium sp. AG-Ba]